MVEPWPAQPRLLGTRVGRVEAVETTTGRARFTYDIARPGLLYGKVIRSPHPHARVEAVDLAPALATAGVRAALALIAAGDRVLYAGQEVAALAAVTEQAAEDAARLVRVRWAVLPHLATVEQAMRPDAPQVFDGGNTRRGRSELEGDVDREFESTAHVAEGLYSTQVHTHVPLETHGCVCEWNGDRLTAWVSTQAVHETREAFAQLLGVPVANVRVITAFMGGGFGSKRGPDTQGLICARLARAARAPVKLMLDRKEEHLSTGNRASASARVRAAVSPDGRLRAFDAETWGTGGAGGDSDFPLPYLYVFPNRRRRHTNVYVNAGRQRSIRGSNAAQGSFITEVVMDQLADAVRLDPMEFRLRNLPPLAPDAMWQRYFPIGAERIGWGRRHPTGDPSMGPIKRGLGCAAHRGVGAGRGARADVQVLSSGAVIVRAGTQDLGTGTATLMAIVAAETLGIAVEHVRAVVGDSNDPPAGASVRSSTAASVASAVRTATASARDEVLRRLARALQTAVERLQLQSDRLSVSRTDGPGLTQALSWRDASRLLGPQPVTAVGEWDPSLSGSGTSGVQFADVEVDVETGITQVRRIVCVQDCGLVVNRQAAESQCCGGIIAGLNYALMEERILDRQTAQMVNPNLEFYLLAGQSDIPALDIVLVDQPERGVIGVADPPAISTAAAIANAVRNATGVTMRSLPITPDKLLGELERAGGTD